jgi:hypothetical protein
MMDWKWQANIVCGAEVEAKVSVGAGSDAAWEIFALTGN